MRFKKWILSSTLFAFLNPLAMAGDATTLLPQKHLIPNAIRIQITDRGMKYFQTNLSDVLANLGVSLDEGFFSGTTWQSDKSYRLKDINLSPAQKQMFQVINSMSNWLVGFLLQDFRPSVKIGNTGYTAQFNRFALLTDEALLHALGKTDGAVLTVEMEIKNVTVATTDVRVSDQNNQFLGQIGADNVAVRIATGKIPLKVRLPFYVRINPQSSQLEFQALQFTNNLDQVNMSLTYQKLIVPQIALEINGHRYELNQKQLEKELQGNLPTILVQLRKFLGSFATEQLPQFLNVEAKKVLTGTLEEVNRMVPAGAAAGSAEAKNPFLWGLNVGSINMQNSLQLGLNAYIEDPQNPSTALLPIGSRGPPNVNAVPLDSYDLALAIDRGLINRALQLSFQRGIFNQISTENGLMVQLSQIPTMDSIDPATVDRHGTAPDERSTFLKIQTRIRVPKGMLSDYEKQAIKEPFEISADIIGKMMRNDKGNLKIMYWDIDPASIHIEDQYLTSLGKLFHNKVQQGLLDKLAKIAKAWRESGKVMSDSFPVPQEFLGIKLELQKVVFDPNGSILLYMNYAHTNGGVK